MSAGMKAMLLRPWFIAAVGLAVTHQVLQKILDIHVPIVDSYLDPLLFLPILLQLILLEQRYVFAKGSHYVLSWFQIVGVVLLVCIVCESLFPLWSPSFTADYIDAICYLIGGVVFGVFFNSARSNFN